METPTLLGYLARFGSFSTQSEVLCTQGLAYLLNEHKDARLALAAEIKSRTGIKLDDSLTWRPEATQEDGGRVDVEAITAEGVPIVKIEAKLGAELTANQLQSYANHLAQRQTDHGSTLVNGALLVLVPRARIAESVTITAAAFSLDGSGPWPVSDGHGVGIAIISWDELFTALKTSTNARFLYELEQLQAMYRVLSGDFIAPLASIEELREWRVRAADFVNLVEQATRKLTTRHKLLPLGVESFERHEVLSDAAQEWPQAGYRRRFVAPSASNPASYYSIGVRDSFAEWVTPIWMRFHKDTSEFRVIRQRIAASNLHWLESGGHVWIPLDAPLKVAGEKMVDALVEQAEQVVRVAWPDESYR